MKRYLIDRIEDGNIAVLTDDDGTKTDVPLSILPDDSESGNILVFENGNYTRDIDEEEKRRKRIYEKRKRLLDKSVSNDN